MKTYTIVFYIDGEEVDRREGLSLERAKEYAEPWEDKPARFCTQIFEER